jgi:hypothetical protein
MRTIVKKKSTPKKLYYFHKTLEEKNLFATKIKLQMQKLITNDNFYFSEIIYSSYMFYF